MRLLLLIISHPKVVFDPHVKSDSFRLIVKSYGKQVSECIITHLEQNGLLGESYESTFKLGKSLFELSKKMKSDTDKVIFLQILGELSRPSKLPIIDKHEIQ